eukprot:5108801-Pyramimonas_sp.AAC.1
MDHEGKGGRAHDRATFSLPDRTYCSEMNRWRRAPGAGAAWRARRTGWARGGPPPLPTVPAS